MTKTAKLMMAAGLAASLLLVVGYYLAARKSDPLSIRDMDLGDATWYDYDAAGQRQWDSPESLADLHLNDGEGSNWNGQPVELGVVVYGDADGDGDEDALASLRVQGQGFSESFYLWLWEGGHGHQVGYPVYRVSRCDYAPVQISFVSTGFDINTSLKSAHSSCADPPSHPVHMRVAARNGYPVQVSPHIGAAQFCDRSNPTAVSPQVGPIEIRTAPEWAAPTAYEGPIDEVALVLNQRGRLTNSESWELVLVVAGGKTYCGWTYMISQKIGDGAGNGQN